MYGDLAARKGLALEVRDAAMNIGFFYASDTGIPDDLVGQRIQESSLI